MNGSRRCVVFDLDDTLFLERDYVHSGFDAVGTWVRQEVGLAGFADDAWQLFLAGHRDTIFNAVLLQHGHLPSPALLEQMVSVYRTHVPYITMLPDAARCLEALHRDVDLALVSDGPLVAQQHKCRALRVDRFFDLIVFTDEWGPLFAKPHPRAFEYVQARMRVDADALFYIGDNPRKDFIAPRLLGWNTVRVRRPLGLHVCTEALPEGRAHVEIADLSTLPDLVSRHARGTVTVG
jgi:putative hydrolase of the HAD superfamily